MPTCHACHACHAEVDAKSLAAGRCAKCGAMVRAVPKRNVLDVRKKPDQDVSATPDPDAPQPEELDTLDPQALDDTKPEINPDTIQTLELNESEVSGGGGTKSNPSSPRQWSLQASRRLTSAVFRLVNQSIST